MLIRATKSGTTKDGSPRITHHLVENQRHGSKVKQKTLLNLGRNFAIAKTDWPLLCQRIKELMGNQPMSDLEPLAPDVEAQSRRIAAQLLERQSEDTTTADWETVDINSVRDHDGRTIGLEHAAVAALDQLGLPALLTELGLSRRQRGYALAAIVGRMVQPGSERATARWLRTTSATGELLGFDGSSINDMALHRAADALVAHKRRIEDHLFRTVSTLFDLQPTIALYDLTNTFFEGQALKQPKARRGHSKERRYDAPLLTLGVVVDGSGFVRRSTVQAGNVREDQTLQAVLTSLAAPPGSCLVMDRGIATKRNLAWLRHQGYQYIVVSNERNRHITASDNPPITTVTTTAQKELKLERHVIERHEEEDKTQTYKEVLLGCHSVDRGIKENTILALFQTRFEQELDKLHTNLARPKTRKTLNAIQRNVGRLQEKNATIAQYYDITVTPDKKGVNATAVSWTKKKIDGSMQSHPGVYVLRSNILDWDSATMWRTYIMLTDVEAVFRSLKSERGLCPIDHQTERRSEGHLFISVLAYQAVQYLRTNLKNNGCTDSWQSLLHCLCHLQRTTISFDGPDNTTIHVRKTATPDEIQTKIYQDMGISPPPRNERKSVI